MTMLSERACKQNAGMVRTRVCAVDEHGVEIGSPVLTLLERIVDHPISRINELLPWNVSVHAHTSTLRFVPHEVMWIHKL